MADISTDPAATTGAIAATPARSRFGPLGQAWAIIHDWWVDNVIRDADQSKVIAKVRTESTLTARYGFMICMSAGIAILGLLLSSPAVVIGAMLLSPLMGPIIGAGFAIAISDFRWLKQCGQALLAGTLIAVLFCAVIVMTSPLQTVTEEIAARTRPNLFDLAVALFSALAGAYAMIRGREGTIVGVAIATALMPPLAVVGFGLATFNWTVFGGSLLLFFTNLMTIALTATIMARLYGFNSNLGRTQGTIQNITMVVVFVALAVPLGFSLQQIAWEANAQRQVNGYLRDQFGEDARVSQVEIAFDRTPIEVNATVFTPEFRDDADRLATRTLSRVLERPVTVSIDQFRVGTGNGDAEAAELAAARVQEQARADQTRLARLADRLALVAGVSPDDVTIDAQRRRALVRAAPLPDADLATYYALEQRVAKLERNWAIAVIPPAAALPTIAMRDADGEDGQTARTPTEAGQARLQVAIWAAQRLGTPVGLSGSDADVAAIAARFAEAGGAETRETGGDASGGAVALRWLAPDAR